jgi:hypothetical protein
MKAKLTCLILLSVLATASAARSAERSPLAGDGRLDRRAAFSVEGLALGDLLAQLSRETNVVLEASPEVADDKVVLFTPSRPLRETLSDLAHLFNDTWVRDERDGKPRYRLTRGLEARKLEARLAHTETARIMQRLDAQAAALAEPPELFARRPKNDPIRDALEDTRFHTRMGTALYALLSPAQKEQMFSGRLDVPFSDLPAEVQAAVRREFEGVIAEEKKRDDELQQKEPGSHYYVSRQGDLDTFGIKFEVRRQSGYISAGVRAGNSGDFSLGTFRTSDWILPPHGSPYDNQPPENDALPAPPAITSAAAERAWVDRLRKLAQVTGKPVLSDYFRCRPVARTASKAVRGDPQKDSTVALDTLCGPAGYLWWTRAGSLYFRKRDWFIQQRFEVPDQWLASLFESSGGGDAPPRGVAVLRLAKLSLSQIVGLNSWSGVYDDESFFLDVPDLLALAGSARDRLDLPLGKSKATFEGRTFPGEALEITLDRRTRLQQQSLLHLAAVQPGPVAPELLDSPLTLRLFRRTEKSEDTGTGYRYWPVVVEWNLHRMITERVGQGHGGSFEVHLPAVFPDDRRSRTRIELE